MTNGTEKKGMSTGAKVAIGCGVAVLLCGIALVLALGWGISKAKDIAEKYEGNPEGAAAEAVVWAHPDLDFVSSDQEAGTITFRNERTGEEATLSYEDIAEGKFSVSTDEGEYSIDASDAGEGGGVTLTGPEGEVRMGDSASLETVPEWVPLYPGASQTQGTYSTQTAEGLSGMINLATGDSAQQVMGHFASWFEDNGYRISSETSYGRDDATFAGITGELEAEGRVVNVGVTEQSGESQVTINYTAKAE